MESKARFFFVAQFSHRKTRSCACRLMNWDPRPSPNLFYLANSSIVKVVSELSYFDHILTAFNYFFIFYLLVRHSIYIYYIYFAVYIFSRLYLFCLLHACKIYYCTYILFRKTSSILKDDPPQQKNTSHLADLGQSFRPRILGANICPFLDYLNGVPWR